MASLSIPYPDFVAGATIVSQQHDDNNAAIVNYVNARNSGTATWDVVSTVGAFTSTLTSNQIILGTTRTVTITAPTPASASRTWTIPDLTTSPTFAALEGTQTFSGAKTFSTAVAITATSAHLTLSTSSNNAIVQASTQATSARTFSIPDISGNGTFAFLEGTQTLSGSKTFSAATAFAVGAVGTPSITFTGDLDTGIYEVDGSASNTVGIAGGGVVLARFGGGNNQSTLNWLPSTDNTLTCGGNGSRWATLWAGNGTVQTSVGRTKRDIVHVKAENVPLPKAARFKRLPGSDTGEAEIMGFLADGLPDNCFAVIDKETGARSTEDVYTSAVIGLALAHIEKLQDRVTALEAARV